MEHVLRHHNRNADFGIIRGVQLTPKRTRLDLSAEAVTDRSHVRFLKRPPLRCHFSIPSNSAIPA
jgi:hypothetical protein